jgi:hypothetical protein
MAMVASCIVMDVGVWACVGGICKKVVLIPTNLNACAGDRCMLALLPVSRVACCHCAQH